MSKSNIRIIETCLAAAGGLVVWFIGFSDSWNKIYSLIDGSLTTYRGPAIDFWSTNDELRSFMERNNGRTISFPDRQINLSLKPPFIKIHSSRIGMDHSGPVSDMVMRVCRPNSREKLRSAFNSKQTKYTFGLLSANQTLDWAKLNELASATRDASPAALSKVTAEYALRCDDSLSIEPVDVSLFDWRGIGQMYGAPIAGKWKVTVKISGGPTYSYKLKQVSE